MLFLFTLRCHMFLVALIMFYSDAQNGNMFVGVCELGPFGVRIVGDEGG